MNKKTIKISGMTCAACESRISRKLLNAKGIYKVNVNYVSGIAVIEFDKNIISIDKIIRLIENTGYGVDSVGYADNGKTNYSKALSALIIIFALYVIINHFGLLGVFNSFPTVKEGMGYGMLFVIGILTSLHCIAMCGGINLSQCVPKSTASNNDSKLSSLRPSLLYNLGRIITYTAVGGIVGAVGSVFSFSTAAKGTVQLIAGVFMVIMGLNMLNLFPGLRRLIPRMPRIFSGKIDEQKKDRGPFFVGLLNGFMPCGPLQAMQLYALSTGDPLKGALSMLIFSLGTTPLMFGLGALSSILGRFTKKIATASAVLIVVLGMFMFSYGINLSGFSISAPKTGSNTNTSDVVAASNVAVINNGVQTITTNLSPRSYAPITVQKGIPVIWTIQAGSGSINGCNNSIVIPEYDKSVPLNTGDNVVEFTPSKSGVYPYSCWMGMIRSSITVVDDITAVKTNSEGSTGVESDYKIPVDDVALSKIAGGKQTISMSVDSASFTPSVFIVQKGIETTWSINGIEDKNQSLKFPLYSSVIDVSKGETLVTFTPYKDFDFSTSDNNVFGYVKVVDDIEKVDIDAIKNELKNYKFLITEIPDESALPSCH